MVVAGVSPAVEPETLMLIQIMQDCEIDLAGAMRPKGNDPVLSVLKQGDRIDCLPGVAKELCEARKVALYVPASGIVRPSPLEVRAVAESTEPPPPPPLRGDPSEGMGEESPLSVGGGAVASAARAKRTRG